MKKFIIVDESMESIMKAAEDFMYKRNNLIDPIIEGQ